MSIEYSKLYFISIFRILLTVILAHFVIGVIGPSASAQTGSDPDIEQPDFFDAIDANGVNLSTRNVIVPLANMSIGEGQGQMPYQLRYKSSRDKNSVIDIYRSNRAKMVAHSGTGSDCNRYDYLITLSGSTELFEYSSGDPFASDDPKSGNSLHYDLPSQRMIYRLKDGTAAYFNIASSGGYCGPGTMDKIVYPDGKMYKFSYIFSGTVPQYFGHYRLASVTSNFGYQLRFGYEEAGAFTPSTSATFINTTADYCSPTSLSCAYSFVWPQVTRVQSFYSSPDQTTTKLNYVVAPGTPVNGELSSVERSGLDTAYFQMDSDGEVQSLTIGNETTSYSYNLINREYADCVNSVTRTNPDQTTDIFFHKWESVRENGLVCKHTDALSRTTVFEPLGDYRYVSATSPEGDREELQFDDRGNVVERRRKAKMGAIADIVTTYSYPSNCGNPMTCNKPISITDPKNNITEYSYDSVHGGILSRTEPADLSGIRPQTRYEYVQRHAWIKDASGAYVPANSPIWVLNREEFCKSTSAIGNNCAGGSADEVITEYDYGPDNGPNNLSLRGIAVTADGQTLRTCYGYDQLGRRISETKSSANLGSCP